MRKVSKFYFIGVISLEDIAGQSQSPPPYLIGLKCKGVDSAKQSVYTSMYQNEHMVYSHYPVIFWCGELRKIEMFKWLSQPNCVMEWAYIQELRKLGSPHKLTFSFYTFLTKNFNNLEI